MEEINEKNYLFSGERIQKWIEHLKNNEIKINPLTDTGSIHYLLVAEKKVDRYKEVNTYLESDMTPHQSEIIPIGYFKNNNSNIYKNDKELLCRIEIMSDKFQFEYYTVISLKAYNHLNELHIYFRDLRFIWKTEVVDKGFIPEEITETVVYLENSISGLSKNYLTEKLYNIGKERLISVENRVKAHYMEIEDITEDEFDFNVIVNPLYDYIHDVGDSTFYISTLDKQIFSIFENYKTYEKLECNINNMIYCNLSGEGA